MDAQLQLQKLNSPRLANTLTHTAALRFIENFEVVEQTIRDNIELSQTVFPRSVDELKLLLGL